MGSIIDASGISSESERRTWMPHQAFIFGATRFSRLQRQKNDRCRRQANHELLKGQWLGFKYEVKKWHINACHLKGKRQSHGA